MINHWYPVAFMKHVRLNTNTIIEYVSRTVLIIPEFQWANMRASPGLSQRKITHASEVVKNEKELLI